MFTGSIFLCLYRFRNIPRNSTDINERAKLTSVSVQNEPFLIIVLAMDRRESLTNLLKSLEYTDFLGQHVQLEIHFDKSPSGTEATRVAEEFIFSHGTKKIFISSVQKGLANSWYTAYEVGPDDRPFIILEDDIVLSPHWFSWCSRMWERYHTRPDLAGISLQRQTLIPKLPSHSFEIVNDHLPYLYALVGSIGFSPNPPVWREFLSWVGALPEGFDVTTPGLVTSDWWNKLDKRHMWTQHFTYFCLQRGYFTLYQNMMGKRTLASHYRARGAHFARTLGPDFLTLRAAEKIRYPIELTKYDWSGNEVTKSIGFDDIMLRTLLHRAKLIQQKFGFVYLMFANSGFIEMTKNWICNIRAIDRTILENIILVADHESSVRALSALEPTMNYFVYNSRFNEAAEFGTYKYYAIVLDRLIVQNMLIQEGHNVMIVESDQYWFADITKVVANKFILGYDMIAGDERSHVRDQLRSYICGGFYGIASNENTRSFFQDYVNIHQTKLQPYEGKGGKIDVENDQALLSRLVHRAGLSVHWLDSCEYMNGMWYEDESHRSECRDIYVLHNNYLVGGAKKKKRALQWGHWRLFKGSCTSRSPLIFDG